MKILWNLAILVMKKRFFTRFGSGYIVYDEDSIEDVVLVQFDSGFRKKVFIYDLENS